MITLNGTTDVVLPSPVFGDKWRANLNTSVNLTVNGTPLVFKGTRPTYYTYRFDFVAVKGSVKDAFLAYIEEYAGYEITIDVGRLNIDCADGSIGLGAAQSITGYITTSQIVVTTDKDGCSYSFGFDFMITAGDSATVLKYQVRS